MASILDSIFGGKPDIADYTDLNFGTEQNLALEDDLAAWGHISQLGSDFQKSYLSELNTAIPGFTDILAEGGTLTKQMESIAGTELSGQLPKDVMEQVQRSSAFQNLLAGGGGSMANANTARNLGLTSLDLISQGAAMSGNAAQRWGQLASASGAGAASNVMSGMLQTPQQRAAFDKDQAMIQLALQQARNNRAAAPNPALQALNQWVEQVGGTAIGALVGAKPGTNYKTTYDPTSAGAPSSDWMNNVTQGGGGGGGGGGIVADPGAGVASSSLNMGGMMSPADPSSYSAASALNSSVPIDLFGGYNPTTPATSFNPFGFGGSTDLSSLLSLTSSTGTSDFTNTQNANLFWGGV